MNFTLISGTLGLVLGIIFTLLALTLPEASVGIAHAPKVFPAGLGILMTIFSLVLMIQEYGKIRRTGKGEAGEKNPYFYKILLTCVFGVIYALLFNRIGYVLSTFLFLEAELWLFNGIKQWKINSLVALLFSIGIYVVFAKLLGVYLPMTPGIWI